MCVATLLATALRPRGASDGRADAALQRSPWAPLAVKGQGSTGGPIPLHCGQITGAQNHCTRIPPSLTFFLSMLFFPLRGRTKADSIVQSMKWHEQCVYEH